MIEKIRKVKRLLSFLTGYDKAIRISVITGSLNRFFSVAVVAYSSFIVGKALDGASKEFIKMNLIILLIVGILKALFAYLEMYWVHYLAYDVLFDYRVLLFNKINEISPKYLLHERTGNVSAILMDDVEQLEVFYAHTYTAYIVSIIASATLCIILAFINVKFLLVIIPAMILIFLIPFFFVEKVKAKGDELKKLMGKLNADVIDIIQGIKEILIFGKRKQYKEKVKAESDAYGKIQLQEGRLLGLQNAAISVILALALILIMVMSNLLFKSGELTKAALPLISVISIYIFIPIVGVSNTAGSFGIIEASADRIFSVISADKDVKDEGIAEYNHKAKIHIKFDNVDFSYDKNKLVLNQLSFDVGEGENVALVGESGAGKSTCLQLLLRFYDADNGSIQINGVDIRDYSLKTLRSMISYVSQDIYLFNMTIEENIALGLDSYTKDEIRAAAKAAYADQFISKLPDGYETLIGERGFRLSGGEKARIAIARALMRQTPILLLDEALSNLDNKNEQLVDEAIHNLSKNKTIITIAHRLNTIRNADRIIVLDGGKVEETGNHNELIHNQGKYCNLVMETNGGEYERLN